MTSINICSRKRLRYLSRQSSLHRHIKTFFCQDQESDKIKAIDRYLLVQGWSKTFGQFSQNVSGISHHRSRKTTPKLIWAWHTCKSKFVIQWSAYIIRKYSECSQIIPGTINPPPLECAGRGCHNTTGQGGDSDFPLRLTSHHQGKLRANIHDVKQKLLQSTREMRKKAVQWTQWVKFLAIYKTSTTA